MSSYGGKIKTGMKGSSNGRGRRTETGVLKKDSKKVRRRQGKQAAQNAE